MFYFLVMLIILINSYSSSSSLTILVGFQKDNESSLFFSELSEALMSLEKTENFNNVTEILICSSENKTYEIDKEIIIPIKYITIM